MFFIIQHNIHLENMIQLSEYIGGNSDDKYIATYDNLSKPSCYAECMQSTSPVDCNYAVTSADPLSSFATGKCTLYNSLTPTYNSTDTIFYMQDNGNIKLPDVSGNVQRNRSYNTNAVPLKTINNIHRTTCDIECLNTALCTNYTSNIPPRDKYMPGTCSLYNQPTTDNVIKQTGTYLYKRSTM
jgi:hypothetical protein